MHVMMNGSFFMDFRVDAIKMVKSINQLIKSSLIYNSPLAVDVHAFN